MVGWIQKQMNSWMDRKKIYEKIGGWLDVQETQKDGWLDGQKNRWLNGQKKLMAEWIEKIVEWLVGRITKL